MTKTDLELIEQLLRSKRPAIGIATHEEAYALSLIRDAALRNNRPIWQWSMTTGIRDGLVNGMSPIEETEHPAAALYWMDRQRTDAILVLSDLAPHLKDAKTHRLLRDVIHTCVQTDLQLVLIDTEPNWPSAVRSHLIPFEVSLPGEEELESLIRSTVLDLRQEGKVSVELTRLDLTTMIRNLRGLSRRLAEQIIVEVIADDRKLDAHDINRVLTRKRQMIQSGGLLEYVEAPVSIDEIGGLSRLKRWLRHREASMQKDLSDQHLAAPRGILLLGVQGAGKSLCAKAIATIWRRPLLRMDVGALYDKYVGESERRLRNALAQAEVMAPIILWIDEIEKAFAGAASQSTDGGLSRRMFGSLLTWMQEHRSPVFLVATANDIEALPPELLRKGRFDEIFFVGLPKAQTRARILEIHLKKRDQDAKEFDIQELVRSSEGFSGAEIEQAIVAALHEAFSNKAPLATAHIRHVMENSPPLSVTMAEKVQALEAWAEGRCMPAD